MKAKEIMDYTRKKLKALGLSCGFKWDVHYRRYEWMWPTEYIISIKITDDGVFVLFRSEREYCFLIDGEALVSFLRFEMA